MTLRNVKIPRDRWRRPMVVVPGGKTKRVAYQRVTTFVDVLDKKYDLMAWKMRKTAQGMALRKDLVVAAAAADPADKELLGSIADQALECALSSAAATVGTALHSFTERVDRGQELGYVPAEHVADIEAYQKATAGIEWKAVEAFRVHDEWKVAGTADRIGCAHGGRLRIYDIKTGSIDYPHKMAMQLAMYAHSIPYDIETDRRAKDEVDLNTGVIIHLPAGEGRCDLYEIDLAKGWGACQIAKQVHRWRGEKGLLSRMLDTSNIVVGAPISQPAPFGGVAWLKLIELAPALDQLRRLWSEASAVGALTDDFRAAARKRSEELGK